jgi:ABC-2 type transport system ATP-binding protein
VTAARPDDPAIEVAGLVKRYGKRTVLDRVDLVVRRGELVALLGPNGAGKTTTVEIIEGYRAADGGSVRVLGRDPRAGGPGLRARVGLMLQGADGLQPRATARESLRLYAAFHAGGRNPDELLATTGLEGVADRPIRRLSGGERQRLALAIALVGEPEVLVLDEPTAGLDPVAAAALRDDLAGLAEHEGVTVFLTTHNLAEAEKLCDGIGVIRGGRLIAVGAPRELRERRGGRQVEVVGRGFGVDLVAVLRAQAGVQGAEVKKDRLVVVLSDGVEVAPLVGILVRGGAEVEEVRKDSASLEEVFLTLMEEN